jgi:biopolymer transport protein ExbB
LHGTFQLHISAETRDVIFASGLMDNAFVHSMDDLCYLFLALNALWGMFCVIVAWRRVQRLRFKSEEAQDAWMSEVLAPIRMGDYNSAAAMCEGDERALPQLVQLAIANRDLGYKKLRQFVVDYFQRNVLADLEYRVSWVMTVIKAGPLLGLYGTVMGMMAAFGRIGTGEKVQPSQIADDISVALIATAMGLTTAIPFTFMVSSINIRLRKMQDLVALGLSQLLDSMKTS